MQVMDGLKEMCIKKPKSKHTNFPVKGSRWHWAAITPQQCLAYSNHWNCVTSPPSSMPASQDAHGSYIHTLNNMLLLHTRNSHPHTYQAIHIMALLPICGPWNKGADEQPLSADAILALSSVACMVIEKGAWGFTFQRVSPSCCLPLKFLRSPFLYATFITCT